jgi:uncharacterized protein (DUF2249 family)
VVIGVVRRRAQGHDLEHHAHLAVARDRAPAIDVTTDHADVDVDVDVDRACRTGASRPLSAPVSSTRSCTVVGSELRTVMTRRFPAGTWIRDGVKRMWPAITSTCVVRPVARTPAEADPAAADRVFPAGPTTDPTATTSSTGQARPRRGRWPGHGAGWSSVESARLSGPGAMRGWRWPFENHLEKENTLLLPLLASTPEVALADLLHGVHRLIGSAPHDGAAAREDAQIPHEGHTCSCGEAEDAGYPTLDARDVPHAIRHATIFGALEAIGPGAGLILVAPHDPKPLLAQLERRNPGVFDVEYLEQGPDAWRLAFVRQPA